MGDSTSKVGRDEFHRWAMSIESLIAQELHPSFWSQVGLIGRMLAAFRVVLVFWLTLSTGLMFVSPVARSQTPSEYRTDARLDDMGRRVDHIEALKPEAVAEKVAQLQASVEKQQNILIALVLAVVTNIISSFPQFVEWRRRR